MTADPASSTTAPAHISARFRAPGPKRILALDGGGTRGIVTLCFLAEIEALLRRRFKNPKLVLSDYFDLIGGTSVGSMLATLLAMGKEVTYIRQLFEGWAPRIFNTNDANYGIFDHVFDARVLRGLVQAQVFDKPLRSDDIKTGLCIISKRADTASVWPVINNPFDQYFEPRAAQGNAPARLGNGDYKLVDLLRASTAAPLYFSPAGIKIFDGIDHFGDPAKGKFVDGGVSPHNCPALQLFMMAGISGYNLGGGELEPRGNRKAWKLGVDNLLLVSVGTGSFDQAAEASRLVPLEAAHALAGMISDGQQLALTLLQWMSMPRKGWHVDRVLGDLSHDLLGDGAGLKQPLLSFQRYDIRLENTWLEREKLISQPIPAGRLFELQDFTNAGAIPELAALAAAAAEMEVSDDDFPAAFDGLFGAS